MVLLEGTKERVLELLRARPRTAKEVAEALGVSRTAAQKHLQDLEDIQEAGSQVQRHELAALRYARRVRIIGVRQQDLRPVSGGGEGAQELRVSHGTVEHERAFL